MRIPLRPKIQYVADFVPKSAELFEHLRDTVVWDERLRARKTASFGLPYNYSGITYAANDMPDELTRIVERIRWHLDMRANNCLVNYYPTGQSSMGFHSDAIEDLRPNSGIAIVSLGTPRTFTFRAKEEKSTTTDFLLEPGSLFYMPLSVQADWQHGLLPTDSTDGRISLTFREFWSGSGLEIEDGNRE
jgi:alkylated DNA repair dioxygenase AlkB